MDYVAIRVTAGHWAIDGVIKLVMQGPTGPVQFGGSLERGRDAKSVKMNNFFIKAAGGGFDVVGHDRVKNKVGRSALMGALRLVSEQLKIYRPGIVALQLEFTRVSGALGAQKNHREIFYDITGDRPRLLHRSREEQEEEDEINEAARNM
jgi:hypothetical protein